MKYINPTTKQVVEIVGVNTASLTYVVKEAADKFADSVTTTVSMPDMDVERYHRIFMDALRKIGLYDGYVSEDEYIDWPTDTELPEYYANYRVALTDKDVVRVNKNPAYRALITDIKEDHIKDHSQGVYVYLTEFKQGHPYVIKYVLELEIESNPNKEVPEIDYTPPTPAE